MNDKDGHDAKQNVETNSAEADVGIPRPNGTIIIAIKEGDMLLHDREVLPVVGRSVRMLGRGGLVGAGTS